MDQRGQSGPSATGGRGARGNNNTTTPPTTGVPSQGAAVAAAAAAPLFLRFFLSAVRAPAVVVGS